MATGQRAFSGNTATVIRNAVLNLPVVLARQLNPELPSGLEKVINKSLEKDPDRRYQTANELRADLVKLGDRRPASRRTARIATGIAAALAVVVLVLLANPGRLRERLLQRAGSPDSAAQFKPRPSVAVLGFKNLSGKDNEAWISTALSEMLGAELAAGQQLRVIPGENVARMKLDLSLVPADSYGQDTLARIRNHLNTDMVVLGSYLAVGKGREGKIRVDLQLQDTKSGETVAVVSGDGQESGLPELISRSGAELRQKLGLVEITAGEAKQVLAAVPANLEAARLYSEGLAKLQKFDALAARQLLEKAVAIDPNHALSHSALAEAWSQLGYKAQAQAEAKRAFDLSAGLSREDRLLIEGRYREQLHDYAAAIEIFRTLRNFFPDDLGYALRLATAQVNADSGNDALQTIARMRTLPDPLNRDVRIDLAEADAEEDLSNFKRSREAAEAAAAKAKAQGSHLLVARARVVDGWASQQLGDPERAFISYSKARELWLEGGNARAAAAALHGIAIVQRDRGDFLAARKSFEEAIAQFRKIGAVGDLASCVHNLGVLLTYQGNLREAKLQYEEALRIQREINDERGVASDLDDLGNVLMGTGDLPGADRMKEQALHIFRRLNNKFGEEITLLNLGEVALAQGQFASAREKFNQAMALAAQTGDRRSRGYGLLGLAKILLAQDHLAEARKQMTESIALRQEIADEATTAESRLQLAKVALEQAKSQEAESLARAASEILDRQKALSDAAEAYAILALALLAEGKNADAQTSADRALTLSRQSEDVMAGFEASLAAASVQVSARKIDAAAQVLETVQTEARRYGFTEYELEARLSLGQLGVQSEKAVAARAHLRQLENEARGKGFLLIARKAGAALRNSAPHVQ
jgi:tetratricopeptide (TPR) repeat protein/TolB-like protein